MTIGYCDKLLIMRVSSGKMNKFGHSLVVVQLIHRLTEAYISCSFFHCLFYTTLNAYLLVARAGDGEARARPEVLRYPVHAPHHVAHVHVHLGRTRSKFADSVYHVCIRRTSVN